MINSEIWREIMGSKAQSLERILNPITFGWLRHVLRILRGQMPGGELLFETGDGWRTVQSA